MPFECNYYLMLCTWLIFICIAKEKEAHLRGCNSLMHKRKCGKHLFGLATNPLRRFTVIQLLLCVWIVAELTRGTALAKTDILWYCHRVHHELEIVSIKTLLILYICMFLQWCYTQPKGVQLNCYLNMLLYKITKQA